MLERIARALDVPVTVFHEEDVEEETKEVVAVANDQNQAIYQSNLELENRILKEHLKRIEAINERLLKIIENGDKK